jgi:hypothetical protein
VLIIPSSWGSQRAVTYKPSAASSCSNSAVRGDRYHLYIGTFGAIPIDVGLEVSNQPRLIGVSPSSPSAQSSYPSSASTLPAERTGHGLFGGGHQAQPEDLASDTAAAQASLEREGKQSTVSSLSCTAPSKQQYACDVGTNSEGLRCIQERSEGSFCLAGFQSSREAAGEDNGGFPFGGGRQNVRKKTRT